MFEKNLDGSWNNHGIALNQELLAKTGNNYQAPEYLHVRNILDNDKIMAGVLIGLHQFWYDKWDKTYKEFYKKYMDALDECLKLGSELNRLRNATA